MSNVKRRTALFAILLCTLALAEPTVWPVPFSAKAMFPAVLELARASACKDIAALIDREQYAAALALTEKTMAGPFLWRGALTNGYQQGFGLYALHGLLLEQHGDVVRAYRAYQNSRACFDDNTVMTAQPEPRLEVFAGIGRMCVEAGRYTDALLWLETARIEGNDQPYLCALADRGLIRRAVEIGDYHDAITNYWDLQRMILETRNLKRAAETNMQSASANSTSIKYPVSSFNSLSRAEYRELAQLYFWTWRDREGFATVLDGITLLGIDNDLGVNDPMVDCFLNNIMRADDAEIQRFYDLLGYAIVQARALKGDEEYMAFLVKARMLMCRVYGFLSAEDDLEKVGERITQVKRALTYSSENSLPRVRDRGRPHDKKNGLSLNPELSATFAVHCSSERALEDALMYMDVSSRKNERKSAIYYATLSLSLVSNTPVHFVYDGTTAHNAAIIECLSLQPEARASREYVKDGSRRAALLEFRFYHSASTEAQRAVYDIEQALALVPPAHPVALNYFVEECIRTRCADKTYRAALLSNGMSRTTQLHTMWNIYSMVLAAEGDVSESFP